MKPRSSPLATRPAAARSSDRGANDADHAATLATGGVANAETLATASIAWDERGWPVPVELPSTLWPAGLHIGDRVVLEVDGEDVIAATITIGPRDQPIVRWPVAPRCVAREVIVRRPRRAP